MVEAAATLQGHLIAAESELSGLQQMYTANNVRVRLPASAGQTRLRQQLDKLGGDPLLTRPEWKTRFIHDSQAAHSWRDLR